MRSSCWITAASSSAGPTRRCWRRTVPTRACSPARRASPPAESRRRRRRTAGCATFESWTSVADGRRQLAHRLEREHERPVRLQAQAVAVEIDADLAPQRALTGRRQLAQVRERELLAAPGDPDDVQV